MAGRTGKALEQLVAAIEKTIADKGNVTIESPKHLISRVTGRRREHDVLLTIQQQHHKLRISIECRDRSRAITEDQVDSFHRKCRDTGVDQGIIVSTTGYAESARTKAAHLGIQCFDMQEAKSFNWMAMTHGHSCVRRLDHQYWRFNIAGDAEAQVDKTNKEVLDENGVPVSEEILKAMGMRLLAEIIPDSVEPIEGVEFCVKFGGSGYSIRDNVTGETEPVREIFVHLTYSIKVQAVPMRLHRYGSHSEGKTIAEAAVAEFDLGGQNAKLMFIRKPNEGTAITLAVDKPTKA